MANLSASAICFGASHVTPVHLDRTAVSCVVECTYGKAVEPAEQWESYWIPSIEDVRGGPGLVHPACFAREHNLSDLITLVTANDRRMSIDLSGSPSQR